MCFVIRGIAIPLILRPKGNGRYNIVGYIYGGMKGEVIAAVTEGEITLISIMIE